MNESDLIIKYEHRLTLWDYSENTLRAYLNGLHIFLDYVRANQISSVTPKVLERYFHHCKKDMGYSYSMMSFGPLEKQLLAYASFLYDEVLKEEIDFDFNIKMKKPSRIPEILLFQEVDRFLNKATKAGKALLMVLTTRR